MLAEGLAEESLDTNLLSSVFVDALTKPGTHDNWDTRKKFHAFWASFSPVTIGMVISVMIKLIVSEGQILGEHSSFYDLFRIEDGKIAEHWDTIETIMPRDKWQNDNGKF